MLLYSYACEHEQNLKSRTMFNKYLCALSAAVPRVIPMGMEADSTRRLVNMDPGVVEHDRSLKKQPPKGTIKCLTNPKKGSVVMEGDVEGIAFSVFL